MPLQITKDSQLIFEGSNFVVLELIINNRGKQYKPGIYSLADFAGSILNRGITIATSNDESYPVRISAETSISAECAPTYPNPLVAESDVVKQSRSYHIGNIRITNLFPQ